MFFGMILWPLLIVGLIWFLWQSQRSDTGHGTRTGETATMTDARPKGPTPREILDQRYARGEIDRNEYLERREDLHQ